MPSTNWDLFFNELFRDYLKHADSTAAGVPAPATVPFRAAQDKEVVSRPRVVIGHEREGSDNVEVYAATFTITGHFLDDATQGTSATQAETWMQKIRQRLADETSLKAYITALSTEIKSGWQPTRLHVPAGAFKRDRDEDKAQLDLSFEFSFLCVVELA